MNGATIGPEMSGLTGGGGGSSYVPLASPTTAGTQPQEYWVSNGSKASDSNSGDKDSPFLTLSHAVSVAEATTHAYHINVGYGNFTITTADGSGNAVTMTRVGSTIGGAGNNMTNVILNGSFAWGIVTEAALCNVEHLQVKVTGGTCTYGVGTTTASSAEASQFRSIEVNDQTVGALTACFAVGPDTTGGSIDLSGITFWDCWAYGNASTTLYGFLFGNGTTGNIVANECYGCKVFDCTNNVVLNACGIRWFGGSFTHTLNTDILVMGPRSLDPIIFVGTRGDNGNVVLDANFSVSDNGNAGGITLIDYEAFNYSPNYHGSTSKILYFGYSGMLKLIGGVYTKNGSGATMFVSGGSATAPATLIAEGVGLDNVSGLPAPTSHLNTFYRGNTYPSSGNNLPVPGSYNNNYVGIGNPLTAVAGAITIPITYPLTTVTNSGAVTLTITFTTTGATDGIVQMVRVLDATAAVQTLATVNTEPSTVALPTATNGSTTLPLTTEWQYNGATSKWRCIRSV